jgi:hypothetical protein
MKHLSTFRLASLICCVLFALSSAAQAQATQLPGGKKPAPKLIIEATEHNFGVVKEGVKIAHTFKIKNEGDANLEIVRVAPS